MYLSNIYNSGITRSCSTTQSPSLLPASHTRHLSNGDDDGDDGDDDGDHDGGDDSDDDGGCYSDDNFEDQGLNTTYGNIIYKLIRLLNQET